jgi:hypothetical protein
MAIPRPRMHLRYAQPRIPVYLSRAKDIKDAFKVCPTPDPCLVVEGQRYMRFPGVPRTKSSILLTIRIHQIRWRVTGLPTTLDAFNAIPRLPMCLRHTMSLAYYTLIKTKFNILSLMMMTYMARCLNLFDLILMALFWDCFKTTYLKHLFKHDDVLICPKVSIVCLK